MSVKMIVFSNGLQIIGDYKRKDEAENVVIVEKPVQVVMVPNQDPAGKPGQVSMGFSPFLQYTEEWETGVPFLVDDMLTVVTPVRELENAYSSQFGSGIVMPPGISRG
jgi:hypothetical protein